MGRIGAVEALKSMVSEFRRSSPPLPTMTLGVVPSGVAIKLKKKITIGRLSCMSLTQISTTTEDPTLTWVWTTRYHERPLIGRLFAEPTGEAKDGGPRLAAMQESIASQVLSAASRGVTHALCGLLRMATQGLREARKRAAYFAAICTGTSIPNVAASCSVCVCR